MKNTTDSLEALSVGLVKAIESRDGTAIKSQFFNLRNQYKRIEALSEFYFPGVSRAINGPALDKVEEGDDKIIPPSGFQVVEEYVFPDVTNDSILLAEARILQSTFIRLRELVSTNEFTDENIFEAVRLQMLRIMSLGISGFDSPIALHSIPEAKAALEGIQDVLSFYEAQLAPRDHLTFDTLNAYITKGKAYLDVNSDFLSFNRAVFIIKFCNPITRKLLYVRDALKIKPNPWPTAVNSHAATFFDPDAFDERFFAPPYNRDRDSSKALIGRLLFFDPILSANNQRSCASCHKPTKAFTDGSKRSVAFSFGGTVKRNAPTLINAGYQQNQFWDGRTAFLEDQISEVVSNRLEMHSNWDDVVRKLNQIDEYRAMFKSTSGADYISPKDVQIAIASYLRTLKGMNSSFDRYMQGDGNALSQRQINGFNVFMGKGKCATCHFLPLFNGSVPPMYSETEGEVIGVPRHVAVSNAKPDADPGKGAVQGHPLFDRMFKTPTLRNIALTAPYMHNGAYQSLEEVIDFYDRGGGAGIGSRLANQTLPEDALNLTPAEAANLIAFLSSLTDTASITTVPSRLPKHKEELNNRRVGGVY